MPNLGMNVEIRVCKKNSKSPIIEVIIVNTKIGRTSLLVVAMCVMGLGKCPVRTVDPCIETPFQKLWSTTKQLGQAGSTIHLT